MKDLIYVTKTLPALIGISKSLIQVMRDPNVKSYQRLGIGLLLAAFALTPNCPGSDSSSNGGGDPITFTLTVRPPANGGIAVGAPMNATCNTAVSPTAEDCTYTLAEGTMITLTATADTGYTFTSWGGDCAGSDTCTLTMDQNRTASAVFSTAGTITYNLMVTPLSGGSIEVSYPPSFTATCSSEATNCTYPIADGTEVTLTATADTGYEFTSWGDDCSGMSGNTCTLTMDQDRTVSAAFTRALRTLTVTPPMNGSIAVGTPVNATCDSAVSPTAEDCTYTLAEGTEVILTTTATTGYEFTSWGDDCSGMIGNMCTLTMSEDRTVSAAFTRALRTLTVMPPTNGSIAVVGTPEDETCNSGDTDCTYSMIPHGTEITLTATADRDYEFTSWGDDCSGSGTCTLTMDQDRTASALFSPAGTPTRMLTVTPLTNGSIEVAYPSFTAICSSGAGECPYTIPKDTVVTLTATGDTGYEFDSWGDDDCSGMIGNTCTLTMSEDRTASAAFTRILLTLTVMPPTNGSIAVVSTPVDMTCNSGDTDCTYSMIPHGTMITLTATADRDYEFTSWGDDCPGTGSGNTCVLTMDADRAARATFTSTLRTLTVTPPTNGSIAVGAPVGMTCNSGDPVADCTYSMTPDGTMITLTATADTGYLFDSWGDDCSGMSGNMCVLTMDADKTASASFVVCDMSDASLDCDHDGTNNGDDAFPDNADVQDAIAIFSLGEMDGDFGFSACDTFLDSGTSPRAVDMRSRGFSTAKFYGSTPDYDFVNLHTDAEGLALNGDALNLPVAVFREIGGSSTHSFPVSSGTTRITIANLVAVDNNGAWTTTNLFANALDPIVDHGSNRFWSFTGDFAGNPVYNASRSCSGATSMSSAVIGVLGNLNTIDGVAGAGFSSSTCDFSFDVLCVARR